jgi:hypothetical protein
MDPQLYAALFVFLPVLAGIAFILAIWQKRGRIF